MHVIDHRQSAWCNKYVCTLLCVHKIMSKLSVAQIYCSFIRTPLPSILDPPLLGLRYLSNTCFVSTFHTPIFSESNVVIKTMVSDSSGCKGNKMITNEILTNFTRLHIYILYLIGWSGNTNVRIDV